jgi:hypothetical protein
MIPSRLEKRLMSIYLMRARIDDPFQSRKSQRNASAWAAFNSAACHEAINHVDAHDLENPPDTLTDITSLIAAVEFRRLLCQMIQRESKPKLLVYLFQQIETGQLVEMIGIKRFLVVEKSAESLIEDS